MKTRIVAILSVCLFISFFIDSYVHEIFLSIKAPILDTIMEWFSHEITVLVVLLIISGLFLYEEHKTKYIPLLFISFVTALIASYSLKFLVMRARPEGVSFFILTVFGYILKIPNYSFPSSHSAMAFGVLPVLDKEFRKLKAFWIFFSIMIAISRIYLNQHYLSDVIAGAIIGYLSGHYCLKLGEKHNVAKRFIQHIRG